MDSQPQALIYPHDLRLRLLAAAGTLLFFAPVRNLAPAASGMFAVLLLYAVSRQRIPWNRLLHVEAFLILMVILMPFTLPGTTLLRVGPLVASTEGLLRASVLACKVTASVLLLSLLLRAAEPLHLGTALRGLHVPESLVRLFIAVVRYVALIGDEFRRLRESMRARGFVARSNWHTWRTYGYLLGMLLVRAIDRAERVEEAMRLRGYTGRFPVTRVPKPPLSDWLAAGALLSAAMLLLIWDRV